VYAWNEYAWDENDCEESDWEENDREENDSQAGNENTAHFSVPWQVKHELEKKKVVHIACGKVFNIVVTDENTIYGWGYNGKGQISIDQTRECYKYPYEISGCTISDKIGNPYSIYVQKTFAEHPEDVQSPKDIFWILSGHLLDMYAMWEIF